VLQRNQDQTRPDPYPAKVACAGYRALPEHKDADQDEQK
jgi:hypothetical protein